MTQEMSGWIANNAFTLSGLVRGQKRKVKVVAGASVQSTFQGERTSLVIKTVNPSTHRTATVNVSVDSNYYRVWIKNQLTPVIAQNQI